MRTYIIIFSLFYCCFLNAQDNLSKDYTYNVGDSYENIGSIDYYTTKGNQMMAVKGYGRQKIIQKHDVVSLKLISTEEITDLPKNSIHENIVNLNNKYYYFFSSWSGKKTKHERLYYKEISFEKGISVDKPTLLVDIPEKIKSYGGSDKFNVKTSRDSSKLMVKHSKIPKIRNKDKNFELIVLQVFDKDLTEIWSKEYKIPHTETETNIIDYQVSTDGDVYILSKIYHDDSLEDKKKGIDGVQNFHIEIHKISKDSEKIIQVGLDDKYINGVNIHLNKTGELTVSGYYTKGKHRGIYIGNNTDGVFVIRYDTENNLIYKKTHEFPLSVLQQSESDKTKEGLSKRENENNAEFRNLRPKYLGINNTGITLIGEQNYHDNMLITKLDNNGELLWMKKLPKKQKSGKDNSNAELSFSYFLSNNYHHLIYIDNIKNINLPVNKVPHLHIGGYGGYLTVYKVNDDKGTVNKSTIFDTNKVGENQIEIDYVNDRLIEVSENEFVIEVLSKKEKRLIKIRF